MADEVLKLLVEVKSVKDAELAFEKLAESVRGLGSSTGAAKVALGGVESASKDASKALDLTSRRRAVDVDTTDMDDLRKIMAQSLDASAKLERGINNLEREAKQSFGAATKSSKSFFQSLSAGGKALVIGGGITAGIAAIDIAMQRLGRAVSAPVKAFGEQEDATAKLAIALGSLGDFSVSAVREYEAFAQGIQDATGISNTAVQDITSTLAQVGGVTQDALKEATQNVIDFATVIGVDFQAAALLFAKANAGETGALSRYGIILDKTIPKAKAFAALQELVASKFGGSALRQAQTFTGSVERLKSTWGDFLKVLGQGATILEPALNAVAQFGAGVNAKLLSINLGAFTAVEGLEALDATLQNLAEQENALANIGISGDASNLTKGQQRGLDDLERRTKKFVADLEKLRPQISFDIRQGDADTQAKAIQALEALGQKAAEAGQEEALAAINELKEFASSELIVRARVDTRDAVVELRNLKAILEGDAPVTRKVTVNDKEVDQLLDKLKRFDPDNARNELFLPIKLDPAFSGFETDLDAILDGVEELQDQPELNFSVALSLGDPDALLEDFKENKAASEEALQLEAVITSQIDTASEADLVAFGDELFKLFRRKVNEGVVDGIEASLDQARRLIPSVLLFREKAKIRAEVIVDKEGTQALEKIRDTVNDVSRKAQGGLRILTEEDLRSASTMRESLGFLREDFEGFLETAETDAKVTTINTMLEQLDDLKAKLPERAAEIQEFVDYLRSSAVSQKLELEIDTKGSTNEVKALGDLVVDLQKRTGAKAIDIIDTRKLAQDAKNIPALRERLGELRVELEETASVGAAFDTFVDAEQFLSGFAKNGKDLATETKVAVGLLADESERLTGKWAELEEVPDIKKNFELAIRKGDIEGAMRALEALKRIAESVPNSVEIQIEIDKAIDSLEKLEEEAEGSSERVRGKFAQSLEEIGIDAVTATFEATFNSILGRGENFGVAMKNIFASMVDALLAELARLAAFKLFKLLLSGGIPIPGPDFFTGIPTGGKPTLGPSGSEDGGAGRRVPRRSLAVPSAGPTAPAPRLEDRIPLLRFSDSITRAASMFQGSFAPRIEVEPATVGVSGLLSRRVEEPRQVVNIEKLEALDGPSVARSLRHGSLGAELARAVRSGRL